VGTSSTTAVLVQNNILGAAINVNGGIIRSIGSGYAISDGSSFTDGVGLSNTTQITVSSGSVTSGTACAIRSSGVGSKVTIAGGMVANAAGNNANPAIYMNVGSGGAQGPPVVPSDNNVVILGGTVESTSPDGYAIQTAGSILVSGGQITAGGAAGGSGRAINLVGLFSNATVSGGTVKTTGSGAVISTATTNTGSVQFSSVQVSGGVVSATGGNAINITGANSTAHVSAGTVTSVSGAAIRAGEAADPSVPSVLIAANAAITVSGGLVQTEGNSSAINASGPNASISVNGGTVQTAGTGNTVNASGANAEVAVSGGSVVSKGSSNAVNVSGASAKVEVNGGSVQSTGSGNAINATNAGSSVTVSGSSQVSALSDTGYAINANGTVEVSGGFVFSYGQTIGQVIRGGSAPIDDGIVVAWKDPAKYNYVRGSADELIINPSSGASVTWAFGGINYALGTSTGFFPIGVTVYADHGLIFDVNTGRFYLNIDGSGDPTHTVNTDYTDELPIDTWAWNATDKILTLNNFSWNADLLDNVDSVQVALVIHGVNGALTIDLANGSTNTFVSSSNGQHVPADGLAGIMVFQDVGILTITGGGTLNAVGGEMSVSPLGMSHGIVSFADLIIDGGTVVARGSAAAFASTGLFFAGGHMTVKSGTLTATGSAVNNPGAAAAAISAGIWIQGTAALTLSGGSVTGIGGPAIAETSVSTGILGTQPGSVSIEGGTITAISGTAMLSSALFNAPASLPTFYAWWRNPGSTDPGGPGTFFADGIPPYDVAFQYVSTDKYVRISSGVLALIDEKELIGTVGIHIADDKVRAEETRATLRVFGLQYDLSVLEGIDISDWFAVLPAGLTVTVEKVEQHPESDRSWILTLLFDDIPLEESQDIFDITLRIPESLLSPWALFALSDITTLANGVELPVEYNPDARFNIAAVFDLFVSAGEGGSVSGSSSSGRYAAGLPINARATASAGYHFAGWTASGIEVLSTASETFSMPQNRVTLTANFERDATPNVNPPGGPRSGAPQTGDGTLTAWVVAISMYAFSLFCVFSAYLSRKKHSPVQNDDPDQPWREPLNNH